jgi:hypothetical protein
MKSYAAHVGGINAGAIAMSHPFADTVRTFSIAAALSWVVGIGGRTTTAGQPPKAVRTPGPVGHRCRRYQPAGQLPGPAVQRGRARAVAEADRPGRELPGQPLGRARHARQRLRMVPGLVPPEATGRRGPRPLFREDLDADQSGRQHIPGAPRRVLGRRGLALPVGLSRAVRARAPEQPHRLPRRRRPALMAPVPLRRRRFPDPSRGNGRQVMIGTIAGGAGFHPDGALIH